MTLKSNTQQQVYPFYTTDQAIDMLYQEILRHTWQGETDSEKRASIEALWEDRFGFVLSDLDQNDSFPAPFLHGPPGNGKTTAIKIAAMQVANDLGMNYVINPDENYRPSDNDFLVVSYELSGQVSAIDFGGLPSKKTVDGVEYMSKVAQHRLAILGQAGAAVLLMDDFSNASPSIQNVALSVTEEKRFQGTNLGSKTFVALTGNLGAQDRTHVSPLSSAMETRCHHISVADTVENFVKRNAKTYNDAVGDCGILGFLTNYEDQFSREPNRHGGPHPCPRAWSKTIMLARMIMPNTKATHSDKMIKLEKAIQGTVGMEAGMKAAAYFRALTTEAQPLADAAISKGYLNEEALAKIKAKRDGGYSLDAQEFDGQFAFALTDALFKHATLARRDVLKQGLSNEDFQARIQPMLQGYAKGLKQISSSSHALSLNHLQLKAAGNNAFNLDADKEMDYYDMMLVLRTLKDEGFGRDALETFTDILSRNSLFSSSVNVDIDGDQGMGMA